MLEKGVVREINKVIVSVEFSSGIQGVQKACEAFKLEKGKQLAGCSTTFGEPESPNLDHVLRGAEEVDITLSSIAETDFAGHFHLGELEYDSFRQFCRRLGPGSFSLGSRD
ncbi:unnamed protein product [Lactuca saligna]|uniref:Uncharacterized protein n=1 Tax=Lactuca saligna TaxID=75948 RepID=A0AA35ZF08_LACSI|nr:unnamed protein product [Lactuca saligna]